ncbi:MAG: hypothetical protein AAF616_13370 [Bacteroidota bacterium]
MNKYILLRAFLLICYISFGLCLQAQDHITLPVGTVFSTGTNSISILFYEVQYKPPLMIGDQVELDFDIEKRTLEAYYLDYLPEGEPAHFFLCSPDYAVRNSSYSLSNFQLATSGTVFSVYHDPLIEELKVEILTTALQSFYIGESYWVEAIFPFPKVIAGPTDTSINGLKQYMCTNDFGVIARLQNFFSGTLTFCLSIEPIMECTTGDASVKLLDGATWEDGSTAPSHKPITLGQSISMINGAGPCAGLRTYTYDEAARAELFRKCASCIDQYTSVCRPSSDLPR